MTTGLTRELSALADESTNYADAGVAIAADQRYRRRRAAAVPVAAGLAALLAVGVAGVRAATSTGHRGSPADTRTVLVLPRVVTPPDGTVPPLPTGHGVGPAVLVYRACPSTCPAYLVTTAGRTYALDVPDKSLDPQPGLQAQIQDLDVSLSPDGRYLATTVGGRLTIRDLTGTGVRREPFGRVGTWSPDGRFVLIGFPFPGGGWLPGDEIPNTNWRVDLRTGAEVPVDRAGLLMGDAVNDSGRVFTATQSIDPTAIDIQHELPADGETVVYAHSLLRPDEALSLVRAVSKPDGSGGEADWSEVVYGPDNRVAVTAFDNRTPYGHDPARSAVVRSDTVTGVATLRAALQPHAGRPFFLGDRLVYPAQAGRSDPIDLYGLTDSGGSVLISQLPPTAEYFVPGMDITEVGTAYFGVRGFTA